MIISLLAKCSVENSMYILQSSSNNIYRKCAAISVLCNNCSFSSFSNSLALQNALQKSLSKKSNYRSFCSQNEPSPPPAKKLPPLMTFPKIVWPSLYKSIRNFFLTTFIIKPYLDREFSLKEFVSGSRKAVEVVSHLISEGNIKALDGLVTSDIIPSLQRSIALMSLAQREQIAINVDDIYFSFPYQVQIGIIFNDDENGKEQKRFVEVTMVYHALKGLGMMRSQGEEPPINMGLLPEYRGKLCVCNYRFVREFTKGAETDWSINLLNHFRPDDTE